MKERGNKEVCPLCDLPVVDDDCVVTIPEFVVDQEDSLARYSDRQFHNGCFQDWSGRERFVKLFNKRYWSFFPNPLNDKSRMLPDGSIEDTQRRRLIFQFNSETLVQRRQYLADLKVFWNDIQQVNAVGLNAGPFGDESHLEIVSTGRRFTINNELVYHYDLWNVFSRYLPGFRRDHAAALSDDGDQPFWKKPRITIWRRDPAANP